MKEVEQKLVPRPSHIASNEKLPAYGRDKGWLIEELKKLQIMETGSSEVDSNGNPIEDGDWKSKDGQNVWLSGKMSGAVYHGGKEMSDLLAEAIKMFMLSNPVSIVISYRSRLHSGSHLPIPSMPLLTPHSSTQMPSQESERWNQKWFQWFYVCLMHHLQEQVVPLQVERNLS